MKHIDKIRDSYKSLTNRIKLKKQSESYSGRENRKTRNVALSALLASGLFVYGLIKFADYREEKSRQAQVTESIDKIITLKVGDVHHLPLGYYGIYYAGMPNNEKMLLIQEKYIPLVQRPLYLPIEQKDLQIGNHSLSLVKVTPEEVILKYLGYKNYEQKVD